MLDTPVTLLVGPRQSGKTTLARQIADTEMRYLTLDDELNLLSAKADPMGLIRSLDRAVIDEIQRAPTLLLAIKKSVDEDRRPGRFLLTGSADLMALPTMADSLAGRMETLTLLPLSQSEIVGVDANWIDNAFAGRILKCAQPILDDQLIEQVLRGGFPEALTRTTARRRKAWGMQYLDALIKRDVRDIASIDKSAQLPRFLRALAQTAGQMCNYTKLGGDVGLDGKTVARYIGIFEQMYLLKRLDMWSRNHLNRIVKTPKLQFVDAGLLATVLDMELAQVQKDKSRFGHVLETYVFSELMKHVHAADTAYRLMSYRDIDQVEVDFVIENPAGELICIEVKASATVNESDLKGLKKLAGLAGDQFQMGVVLYNGEETLPLGPQLWAAPLSSLWGQ